MKKILVTAALGSALALAACADSDAPEAVDEGDTTVIDATEPADTVVVDEADSDGDSVTISEDGVQADIQDGDTSVSINADGNPSATVEVD